MQSEVAACDATDPLQEAARLMQENDCGLIPITDSGSKELRGVVTDRDLCMAAYARGLPLTQIKVSDVMNKTTQTCGPEDDVSEVHDRMRRHQVRRVPVVDAQKSLVGIVSLNDLAAKAANDARTDSLAEVAITLAQVGRN